MIYNYKNIAPELDQKKERQNNYKALRLFCKNSLTMLVLYLRSFESYTIELDIIITFTKKIGKLL